MSIWPLRRRTRSSTTDAPALRSLSPAYDDDRHAYYVSVLVDQLTREGADAPRNIALTGHYGSGKSSVLTEVRDRLNARRMRGRRRTSAINISLSSLGGDEARVGRVLDDKTPPLTNLIQKEIVKQLLYRERPDRMRGSRYRRTDTFHAGRAAAWSAAVALSVATLWLLAGALDRVHAALPASWADISWAPWAAIGVLTTAGAVFCWCAARALHNRVWIEKLSAGPATVSLQNTKSSYFDEYLDEVVHFFQASGTSVVIFEDLDRFKDPHIFETLRELNTVLNNSQQIRHQPIRFVYAIKDSIFETLAADPHNAPTADEQRSATMNRTKFFDLVVPIVPFISHRTARGLVRVEFQDAEIRPSDQILEIIAPHLTDMRLVKNIRNEYEVFSRHILPPRGPDGLEADLLLGMLVYKNLHMGDHELIREGRSLLDELHRAFREMVTTITAQADDDARAARTALNALDDAPERSVQLGTRLLEVMDALAGPGLTPTEFEMGGSTFDRDQVTMSAFWRDWATSRASIDALNRSYGRVGARRIEDMETLLGFTLDRGAWDEERRAQLELAEASATRRRNEVSSAKLHELMADAAATVERAGEQVTLRSLAQSMLDPLTVDLIAGGFLLDENYTLYVATFEPGVSLRATAFILHSVQPDVADLRFKFDKPEEIAAVAEAEPRRFLHGQAAFNIEVFDYFLEQNAELLRPAAEAIAIGDPRGRALVDAYLLDGKHRAELIALLAPVWAEIFTYLAEQDGLPSEDAVRLMAVAAKHVQGGVVYTVNDSARSTLAELATRAAAFTEDGASAHPEALADLLKTAGIRVRRLDLLTDRVRDAVVARDLYEVTRANLRTVLGPTTPLMLETVKAASPGVYAHVLRHLDVYLSEVLSPQDPTISSAERWLTVIVDVASVAQEFLRPVVERTGSALTVTDLEDAPETSWQALARSRKFAPTAPNLAVYVDRHGVDDALRDYLGKTPQIDPAGITADAAHSVAVMLVNAAALKPKRLARLVASMQPSVLSVSELTAEAKPAVPDLLREGVLRDAPENYTFLAGEPWPLREALINASPGFGEHFLQLDLSKSDFRDLSVQGHVPSAVRSAILDNLASFDDLLEPLSSEALASWALKHEHKLDATALILLAANGASRPSVLSLLAPMLPELAGFEIEAVLTPLGPPYADLLGMSDEERVHHLPKAAPAQELLKRLREL
ncbi:MAG: hypothetical protein IE923_05775 [Micrococcales bacterium]|nr:hypothetical protein [Micrococcales bacterium]